jgi:HEAT repeat protein
MLLAGAVLAALVLVPYLFWRGTWFGGPLPDAQLEQYLNDDGHPRHIQHALVQISQRLDRADPTVQRWYPRVATVGHHPMSELRVTAAWLMGQDNKVPEFHRVLLELLQDPEPVVRRNAALSLTRFADNSGHAELLGMLRPYVMRAPRDGVLRYRLQLGDSVDRNTLIARVEAGEAEPVEIRSPLPGKFQGKIAAEGARIAKDQEILSIDPGPDHVWEALRALYLVGAVGDLPDVERFKRTPPEWPVRISQQAALTAEQIRSRAGS